MDVNAILNSYLQRRGYLSQKESKVDISLNLNIIQPSPIPNDIQDILKHYFSLLETLDDEQRSQLAYLNFKVVKYLEGCDFHVPEYLLRNCFISSRPVLCTDKEVQVELSKFDQFCAADEFLNIFSSFITRCDQSDVLSDKNPALTSPALQSSAETPDFVNDDELFKFYAVKLPGAKITCADSKQELYTVGFSDGRVLHWTEENFDDAVVLRAHSSTVFSARHFHQHPHFVMSACEDGLVKLWDFNVFRQDYTAKEVPFFCYEGHNSGKPVFCVDIQNEDEFFATGGADQKVCVFDVEHRRPFRLMSYPTGAIQCLKICEGFVSGRTGATVVSCSADKLVCCWSINDAMPVRVYRNLDHYPTLVAYHPTAHVLILGSADKKLTFIDIRNDKVFKVLDLEGYVPYSIDFDFLRDNIFYVSGLFSTSTSSAPKIDRFFIDFSDPKLNDPIHLTVSDENGHQIDCCHSIRCADRQIDKHVVILSQ